MINRKSIIMDRLIAILITAGCALGAVLLFYIDPVKTQWLPPCMFHYFTGLYCPGCGSSRGLHQLMHGNLIGAWHYNPLMVLCLPLMGYVVAGYAVRALMGRQIKPISFSPRMAKLIVIVITSYWILRNVPVYPFTLLAPH